MIGNGDFNEQRKLCMQKTKREKEWKKKFSIDKQAWDDSYDLQLGATKKTHKWINRNEKQRKQDFWIN